MTTSAKKLYLLYRSTLPINKITFEGNIGFIRLANELSILKWFNFDFERVLAAFLKSPFYYLDDFRLSLFSLVVFSTQKCP